MELTSQLTKPINEESIRFSGFRIRDQLNNIQAAVEALRDSTLPVIRQNENFSDSGVDGIYYLFGHVSQSISEVEQVLDQVNFVEKPQ